MPEPGGPRCIRGSPRHPVEATVSAAEPSGTAPPTAPGTPNTSPFPPSAPTNLAASEVRTGSVTLTWTAARPGCCAVTGYDITYYQAFDDVIYSASVGAVTTATISNYIRPGRQYSFRVAARDSLGHRSTSTDALTVVTPMTDTDPDTTPPSAPQNLTVGEVTASTATLSWSPSTDNVGVLGYNVYQFDGWFTSTLVATVPGTTYTASLPASTPLRNLFYVRARDAVGNVSIASNTVALPTTPTPPPPPPPTCRVTYRNQSEWQGGFVATVTVQNTRGGTDRRLDRHLQLPRRPAGHLGVERHARSDRCRRDRPQRRLEPRPYAERLRELRRPGAVERQRRAADRLLTERRSLRCGLSAARGVSGRVPLRQGVS